MRDFTVLFLRRSAFGSSYHQQLDPNQNLSVGPSLETSFICCLRGCGQSSWRPMYQNEASHKNCYTDNLPKKHRFFLIEGLSMHEEWSRFDKKVSSE